MKNSANTKNSRGSALLPTIVLASALAQGCATTTKNDVENILELPQETLTSPVKNAKALAVTHHSDYELAVVKHEKIQNQEPKSTLGDKDLSPQNSKYIPTVKFQDVVNGLPDIYKTNNTGKSSDLKMNLGVNGVTILNGNSKYNLGYQYSEKFGSIVGLEYGYMNGKWGTLATVKIGGEKKSFLLTGVYQGVDWGVKASVGALFQKFEGKTINQNFAGVEVIRDLSEYIEGLSVKGYANATHTQDKTLSVTEISNKVAGGTEFITTTTEFKGGTNVGGGLGFNYDINDNHSLHGSAGYTSMNGGGADALIGYEYRNDKLKLGADYSTRNTKEFGADTYAAKVSYILQPGLVVGIEGKKIDSNTLNDYQGMATVSYTPGLKTFDKQGSKISLANLTPVTGANQAMDVLYGKKVTTVEKRFVADKVTDTQAPVLSSTNQSFFTTVGVPLTLVTVLANDNVDGAVTVTQTGTVNFNVAGTYPVVYTATDSAGNTSTITHSYVVNTVADHQAPVLSSTTQTFTTTVGTPLTLATVTANDNVDGALTVTQTGTVDFNTAGTYTVTYTATDAASNTSSITHTYVVNAAPVLDTTAPVLSSTTQTFTTTAGTPLTLATVTANDNVDGALTVTQTGTVDFNTVGTYTVTYTATDAASNTSTITHTYVVNAAPVLDTTAPVLSSTTQTFTTTAGTPLTLATVTANDNVDGALTVTQTGTVDFNTVGTYTVTYTATDAASNTSTITHTYVVNAAPVLDTTAPVLSSTTQTFTTTAGTPLTLATVTANDNVDGALTVTQSGTVDFNTAGTYTVTYSATDAASNTSTITHTYVVNAAPVLDTTAPVLSSTTQTFTTTAGTPLTLATVTANDNVDGALTVTQTGTVDFNTAGIYTVTYTATDAASNTSSITHTYVVNAPISTPTISISNQTIGDDGGGLNFITLSLPSVSGVLSGAVYSLESNPFGGMLTINSLTGVMTWNGDLWADQTESITIKVTNPDGGNQTATFNLTVIDNL